jgi:15-cis-phytoene synthase
METAIISHWVGSAQHCAISDDSLKDEDNAAWVVTLDSENRQAWLDRIEWIRLADRLAESDLVQVGQFAFQQFCQTWQTLQSTGTIAAAAAHQEVLQRIQSQWFSSVADPVAPLNVQAWNRYLAALQRYHEHDLVIDRLSHYTQMLETLAGSFFQVLPYLTEAHWQAVYQFGAVDQFYNNLRDMCEDAKQGICYVPLEVLDRFGVTRTEILNLTACANPGYRLMMEFWVEDYLSQLYQKACRFIMMPDLHPSWEILRAWSLNRYRRIERMLRQCDYDYVQFPYYYWRAVQQELFPQPSGSRLMTLATVMQMVTSSQSEDWIEGLEERLLSDCRLWGSLEELEESGELSHVVAADSFAANPFVSAGDRDRCYCPPIPA